MGVMPKKERAKEGEGEDARALMELPLMDLQDSVGV